LSRTTKIVAAAVAAAIAAVGGIAYATTTGGSGTLAACAQTQSGQLRLDTGSGCLNSEQAVRLGTAAATRADERYYVASNLFDTSTYVALPNGNLPSVLAVATKVVTMHVPAGNYATAAEAVVQNHTGSGSVVCLLLDSAGQTHGYAQTSVGIDTGYNRNETLVIDGALSLASDDDISLTCWNGTGNTQVAPGTALVGAADITTKSVDAATITQEVH
jgi:hypothetical protein